MAKPRAIARVDWDDLARWRLRQRRARVAALFGFLIAISVPLLIPYAWLVGRAFGLRAQTDIWWMTVVTLGAAFTVMLWLVAAEDRRVKWIGAGVLCVLAGAALAVTAGPALSLDEFGFLLRPSESKRVWRAFGSSLYVAMSATVIVVIISSLAGYYISRFRFPLRNAMLITLLTLHAVPLMVLIIPLFLLMNWLGLLDRLTSVVFVLVALELPFAVFIMKGFFDTLPWDIEMAAIVDGATRRQAFVRIMLPQVRSGMVVVSVFSFVRGWEEFVFVSVFTVSTENWVMSLFLFFENNAPAVALFYMLPPVLGFLLTQKYFLRLSLSV